MGAPALAAIAADCWPGTTLSMGTPDKIKVSELEFPRSSTREPMRVAQRYTRALAAVDAVFCNVGRVLRHTGVTRRRWSPRNGLQANLHWLPPRGTARESLLAYDLAQASPRLACWSGANGSTESVGESYARVGGYAHSCDFLNIGGEEIFCCLSGVAAGDEEVCAGVQASIHKRAN
jgi:hypothetical protein